MSRESSGLWDGRLSRHDADCAIDYGRAMRSIVIGRPRLIGSRIEVDVDPGGASRYFRETTFFVEYGDSVELDGLDPALLVIPVLGTVVPVAWALGLRVHVERVDAVFATACDQLADVFRSMYPVFAASGFGIDGERVVLEPKASDGALQLYSGGVDSATTLIRHRAEVRELVTVWGADVALENKTLWQQLSAVVAESPLTSSHERVEVRSNLRTFVDDHRLNYVFGKGLGYTDWWPAVHHAIGLISLTAPLAATRGRRTVYFASGASGDFPVPWGSAPHIDALVRWAGTRIEPDGSELTRQAKLGEVLAPWIRAGNPVELAVCYKASRGWDGQINCGHCEKCLRTASGLLAAGVDPRDTGIPVVASSFAAWRAGVERGDVTFGPNEVYQWRDLRKGAQAAGPSGDAAADEYLGWLATFDFTILDRPSSRPEGSTWQRRILYFAKRGFRRLPLGLKQALRRRLPVLGN
jgi:hypothetical protein